MVVLQQNSEDRVERQAGGVCADLFEHCVGAVLLQNQDCGEHLGHGLDAELIVGVAYVDGRTVKKGDTDTEQVGVDVGQERNIIGVMTTGYIFALIIASSTAAFI